MSGSKKLDEGFERIKVAEKSLKTSLLKWRPDYEVAAEEYSQAATCFKNAKSFERSKECLLKAADCHRQNNAFFHAARCIDQAVLLAKDLNDFKGIPELAEKACNYYRQHGFPQFAATSLDKAAKILEATEPKEALKLYQKAADVVMIEDSPRQAAEFISKVARIMVNLRMYDQATEAIRQEIGLHESSEHVANIGRLAVALILVQLARGDAIAAEKDFKQFSNYFDLPEANNMELLLQGVEEDDPEVIKRALNHPFIKHMDVEYARLARDLHIPTSNPTSKQNFHNGGAEATNDDEDEGLC